MVDVQYKIAPDKRHLCPCCGTPKFLDLSNLYDSTAVLNCLRWLCPECGLRFLDTRELNPWEPSYWW